jgi:hypothetical protein
MWKYRPGCPIAVSKIGIESYFCKTKEKNPGEGYPAMFGNKPCGPRFRRAEFIS